jgi:hypothetical protein
MIAKTQTDASFHVKNEARLHGRGVRTLALQVRVFVQEEGLPENWRTASMP